MKTRIFLHLLLFSLVFIASLMGCAPKTGLVQSKLARITSPDVAPASLAQLVDGNNSFALGFYQQIRTQPGNQFFSPYSISLALAMTYAGARDQTAKQMTEALHYTLPPEQLHPAFNALDLALIPSAPNNAETDKFQLSIANSLWLQKDYPFLQIYLDLLAQNYAAGLHTTDFTRAPDPARQAINDWISQETKAKIKDMIPAGVINQNTRLVLANAIYFKALWSRPFDPSKTANEPFQLLDRSQVSVPMMAGYKAYSLPYMDGVGFQAIKVPYVGDTTAMLLIVPDEGNFTAFEATLDGEKYKAIQESIQPTTVALKLPKFQFNSSYDLNETLQVMGMVDAFNPATADFSGMDGQRDLFISAALHKAFVSVDERGTEAAVSTIVSVEVSSAPEFIELTIDRPFIFVIQDRRSGAILFLGRLVKP
jgi:serpin B